MKGKIAIITILVIFMFSTVCFASSNVSVLQKVDKNATKIVDKYTYECIENLMLRISKQLKSIDEKLDEARITTEYEKYPLIRLSIDSPYFGLTNVIDSRLNIKNAVSTLDMAKGYSIRSVINSKTILVENLQFSSFVFSTRRIQISENMLAIDAHICLEKLISYLDQTEKVSRFVDMELSNLFIEYVSDNKNMDIAYIQNEIKNVKDILKAVENQLAVMDIMCPNDISYSLDKYADYLKKLEEFETVVSNPLSNESDLELVVPKIIEFKNEVKSFYDEILNSDYTENINLNLIIQNVIINMTDKLNYLYSIMDYEVSESEENNILGNLNKYISSTEKYRQELSDILLEGRYDNQDLDLDENKVEIEKNKIIDIYLKFLSEYNVTIMQYINLYTAIIKDMNLKKINMTEEMLYIYVDLDNELEKISKHYIKDNIYSNITTINRLIEISDKIYSIYNNIEVETNEK